MSTVLLNILLILVLHRRRRRSSRRPRWRWCRCGRARSASWPTAASAGQTVARLTENPNRFLSAVQIGVTLAGFLSAAFGGATLADDLSPVLQRTRPVAKPVADTIAWC